MVSILTLFLSGILASSACCIPSTVKINNNDNINELRKKSLQTSKESIKNACCASSLGAGYTLCSTATCVICTEVFGDFLLAAITSN